MNGFELIQTPTYGDCMGPQWQGAIAVVNPNLPARSGDVVWVAVRDQATGAVHSVIKYLEATRSGHWFLQCLEGVVPICAYFVPAAVFPVIGTHAHTNTGTRGPDNWREGVVANRKVIEQWDRMSLDARAEWAAEGKLRGVAMPPLERVLAESVVPTCWPDSFRLPDGYLKRMGTP